MPLTQVSSTNSGDKTPIKPLDLTKSIDVGGVVYRNSVLLAPMSGVSDVPFRKAAWHCGAGMVTSEMVASESLVTGNAEMALKLEGAGLPVHVVQLAGRQAKWMAHAARIAEGAGANVIDINMGCPARKVTNGYSGSALMRDLDHALTLIDAVVGAVEIPVTLKMRLGWDEQTMNAPELSRRAVDAGVQLLSVHGRTRCQFYKGKANWDAVRLVKQAVNIPVIINGDIIDRKSAERAITASGADGVMIGRGAYGNPQLAGQISGSNQSTYDLVQHYQDIIAFYGEELGVKCARKHIGWWLDLSGLMLDGPLRREIMTSKNSTLVLSHLEQLQSHPCSSQQTIDGCAA